MVDYRSHSPDHSDSQMVHDITMNNIFLEGKRGSGKSSLLLDVFGDLFGSMAGYGVERVMQEMTPVGFCVVPVSEHRTVNVPFSDRITGDMFIRKDSPDGIRPGLFSERAACFLAQYRQSRAVLIDEFGGIELTDPVFTSLLKEVISSPVPCVGVFKSEANARSMSSNMGLDSSFLPAYDEFRSWLLSRRDTVLINTDAAAADDIRSTLTGFRLSVLSPDSHP